MRYCVGIIDMGSKYVCRCQDCANNQLMVHFKEGHVFQITIDGKTYDVDFKKALQRNQRTKERTIRCVSGPRVHWEMAAPPSNPDMLAKLGRLRHTRFEICTSGGVCNGLSNQSVTNPSMISLLRASLHPWAKLWFCQRYPCGPSCQWTTSATTSHGNRRGPTSQLLGTMLWWLGIRSYTRGQCQDFVTCLDRSVWLCSSSWIILDYC